MTYEYVCTSCGHAWEAEQSISAAPLTHCPNCKKECAKRQISGGAGFILRGGGWYADGYGSSKSSSTESSTDSGSPAKKPSKPDSGSGSSSDGGSKTSAGSSEGGGAKSAASESVTI